MGLEASVTRWIGRLKAGDPDAAQKLWERYFRRLVGLARKKLGAAPAPRGRRGRRRPQCLRQLLPGGRAGRLPPAARPPGPVAAPRPPHRPQGAGPGAARAPAQAGRRCRARRGRPGGARGLVRPGSGPGTDRRPGADARLRRPGGRGVQPLARAPGQPRAARRRPVQDGGLQQRGDRRPARLRPAHGRARLRLIRSIWEQEGVS